MSQPELNHETTNGGSHRWQQVRIWLLIGIVALAAVMLAGSYYVKPFDAADVTAWLKQNVGPPVRALFAPLDRVLNALPMWVAQVCAIGLFFLAGIFAWSMPRRFIYLGAPDQARWRDLRIWATLVLVPYIIIYYLLGR